MPGGRVVERTPLPRAHAVILLFNHRNESHRTNSALPKRSQYLSSAARINHDIESPALQRHSTEKQAARAAALEAIIRTGRVPNDTLWQSLDIQDFDFDDDERVRYESLAIDILLQEDVLAAGWKTNRHGTLEQYADLAMKLFSANFNTEGVGAGRILGHAGTM